MNKAELIANVAATAGLTKKDAEKAINAFIENIEGALKKGEKVQLVGFGTLKYVKSLLEQAETPQQALKSRFPLARSPLSKLVRA